MEINSANGIGSAEGFWTVGVLEQMSEPAKKWRVLESSRLTTLKLIGLGSGNLNIADYVGVATLLVARIYRSGGVAVCAAVGDVGICVRRAGV